MLSKNNFLRTPLRLNSKSIQLIQKRFSGKGGSEVAKGMAKAGNNIAKHSAATTTNTSISSRRTHESSTVTTKETNTKPIPSQQHVRREPTPAEKAFPGLNDGGLNLSKPRLSSGPSSQEKKPLDFLANQQKKTAEEILQAQYQDFKKLNGAYPKVEQEPVRETSDVMKILSETKIVYGKGTNINNPNDFQSKNHVFLGFLQGQKIFGRGMTSHNPRPGLDVHGNPETHPVEKLDDINYKGEKKPTYIHQEASEQKLKPGFKVIDENDPLFQQNPTPIYRALAYQNAKTQNPNEQFTHMSASDRLEKLVDGEEQKEKIYQDKVQKHKEELSSLPQKQTQYKREFQQFASKTRGKYQDNCVENSKSSSQDIKDIEELTKKITEND